MKKIVTIGGGTGTAVVLSGLKNYDLDLTAIISMADDGGSTGRLRDEFGFQPVGDLRQSLTALARNDSQEWIRKLLLYRFKQGNGLKGHNLGNLILTALQDMTGSTSHSLEIIEELFKLKGKVLPSTSDLVQLVTEYENGQVVTGQNKLNPGGIGGVKISSIRLEPAANIYSKTAQSIEKADLIVINPGDLYGSIIPNLLVVGMKDTLMKAKAKIVYVLNLMTRYTQTHNFKASDHIKQLIKYGGRKPDIIIINNQPIEHNIKKTYEKENEYPVINDLSDKEFKIISAPLLKVVTHQSIADEIKRSLLRHDGIKLGEIIITLV